MTAHNFSEVRSVDHIIAFQEWTAIPTRNSFIYLRNIHGSYLCATTDGKIESWYKPTEWERWTVEICTDGSMALISHDGFFLSDCPDIGIFLTMAYGLHKWRRIR